MFHPSVRRNPPIGPRPACPFFVLAVAGLLLFGGVPAPAPALETVTSALRVDREFPGLLPFVLDGWDLKYGMSTPLPYSRHVPVGATARLTLRNESDAPREADSVLLNGINLAKQIAPRGREHRGVRAASYLLNGPDTTPPEVKDGLEAAGQPVWFQVRPNPIPPGGFAEATIRLRQVPRMADLKIEVGGSGKGAAATARLAVDHPARLAIVSVCFSNPIDRAYVYLRNDDGDDFEIEGASLDGRAVGLSASTPRKSAHGFLPLELPLDPPWAHGSFHHIAATTKGGETVATVVRARDAFFALGMWGYRNNGNTDMERARDTCAAFRDHGFNVDMGMAGGQMGALNSPEGHAMLEDFGLRLMVRDPTKRDIGWKGLYARFLMDEPDAHEYAIKDLPDDRRLGAYAEGLVERQRQWTEADPRTLELLNVDLTYKPENWLTYGPLPDILAVDPYYQMRLLDVYTKHPGWLARDSTPYYVFAISEIARWAAEPRPLHAILNSVSFREGDRTFRFGTPEEKRIEFYYALAAGAKGISYWWFTPYGACHGCGSDEPAARAMMDEMARLNAEARSLEPLLARAHPAVASGTTADPFVSARPAWLMTRTLFAGPDTMLVVCVNRDHASDRVGTLFEPIPKAPMTVEPPPWLSVADSFRLTRDGVKPAPFAAGKDGALQADLKDIRLTEIVVLTANPDLRARVESRFDAARALFVRNSAEEE